MRHAALWEAFPQHTAQKLPFQKMSLVELVIKSYWKSETVGVQVFCVQTPDYSYFLFSSPNSADERESEKGKAC